jgi:predicted nucleotidyltransferase component of viral defense system
MIPRDYITEWRAQAPWVDDAQVEQDLVISRALVEMFSNPTLHDALAFRGGTALFKLHLPAARYSEDIDLVQINAEPAGPIMDVLHSTLDPWLGKPRYRQGEGRDLFDLAVALDHDNADPPKIIEIFYKYMAHGGHAVTRGQFEQNIADKLNDRNFTTDIGPLLGPGYSWDLEAMSEKVQNSLISLLTE